MSATWPEVRLGDVLTRSTEAVTLGPAAQYRQITVKLWGKGVVQRSGAPGATLGNGRRFVARARQLILSRIDARNGAIGIVPPELDGAVVSNDFPLFDVDQRRVELAYLGWIVQTRAFVQLCRSASEGTTNRIRLREDHFLGLRMRFPPLEEQRRIAARTETLARKLAHARLLRETIDEGVESIVPRITTELFEGLTGSERVPIRLLGENRRNPIQIGPFGAQLHAFEFVDSGIPVLNVGNVWPGGLRLDRLDHVTPEKAAQLRRYTIRHDDLLFARSGATLGKVCIVPPGCDGWLMTGHLFRVRLDTSRCEPRFVFAALRGAEQIREQVFGQVRGATRPGFNTSLLGNVEVPLPPVEEQRRIVSRLEALQSRVDRLRRLQTATVTELQALMPAILDRAFKGEL